MPNAHTPGPWSINDWPQASSDIAVGAAGTPVIARVPLRDVSINEQKDNARLIAASPVLLAMLLECTCQIEAFLRSCDEQEIRDSFSGLATSAKLSRAVIDKVRGES